MQAKGKKFINKTKKYMFIITVIMTLCLVSSLISSKILPIFFCSLFLLGFSFLSVFMLPKTRIPKILSSHPSSYPVNDISLGIWTLVYLYKIALYSVTPFFQWVGIGINSKIKITTAIIIIFFFDIFVSSIIIITQKRRYFNLL